MRSSPSPTPTASGRPTPSASWSSPSPTPGSATSAARSASPTPIGGNLEGAYWRYEMAVREMESALAGVTAGNGGIYAVRREAYVPLPPSGSHDLSFPFALAKRGLLSLYAPRARAEEKMVPTLEGEFARKRRMMVGLWDIVVGEGMLSPRGYSPLYAFELASHRLLRYLTPFLHLIAFARQPGAARPGLGLRRDARGPTRPPCRRSARPGAAPRPAPLRPLLRDDHGLDRRRPLGPRPPRRPGAPGRRPKGPGERNAARSSTSASRFWRW